MCCVKIIILLSLHNTYFNIKYVYEKITESKIILF